LFLRTHLKQHWTKYIEQIVESLNTIPLKRLGDQTPNYIGNNVGSVLLEKTLNEKHMPIPKEPTYKTQQKNALDYLNRANQNKSLLKIGDYVYKNLKEDLFSKSFDIKVRRC